MLKEHIVDFCKNIRNRQIQYGPQDAFRFRQYSDGKAMFSAEYGRRADEERAATRAGKQRDRRAAIAKGQGSRKRKPGGVTVAAPEDEQIYDDPAFSNIDPNLRPLPSPASTLPGHGIPSPRHTPPEPERYVTVGFSEMERLKRHGYTGIPAINGPNDGPPMYSVPATARRFLDSPDDFSPPSGILPTAGRSPDTDTDLLPTHRTPVSGQEKDPGPRRSQRSRTTTGAGKGKGKDTTMSSSKGGRKTKNRGG